MKTLCEKGGLVGNFSNHSGKRTCATQLYMAGVEEQEIMARTGHRSERSVRKYKRSSDEIADKVSDILNPPPAKQIKLETHTESMDIDNGSEIDSNNNSARPLFQNCTISFNYNNS